MACRIHRETSGRSSRSPRFSTRPPGPSPGPRIDVPPRWPTRVPQAQGDREGIRASGGPFGSCRLSDPQMACRIHRETSGRSSRSPRFSTRPPGPSPGPRIDVPPRWPTRVPQAQGDREGIRASGGPFGSCRLSDPQMACRIHRETSGRSSRSPRFSTRPPGPSPGPRIDVPPRWPTRVPQAQGDREGIRASGGPFGSCRLSDPQMACRIHRETSGRSSRSPRFSTRPPGPSPGPRIDVPPRWPTRVPQAQGDREGIRASGGPFGSCRLSDPQMACRIHRETSGRSSRSPRFSTRPPGPSPGPRIDVPPRWPTRVPQAQGDREGIRASGGPFGSCRLSDPQMACRIHRETSGRSSRSPRFSTRPPGPSPGPRIDVPPRWPTRVPQAQGDREGIRASGGPFGSCRLSDPQMACRIHRETSGRSSRSPRFSTRPPGPSPGPRIDVPPRWPTRVPQAQGDREGIRASGGPFGSCRLSDPQMACRIHRETSGRSSRSPRFSTRPPGPSPGPRIDVPPRWPTRVPQAQGDREGIRASGGPFGSCRLSDPQMACRIHRVKPLAPHARP